MIINFFKYIFVQNMLAQVPLVLYTPICLIESVSHAPDPTPLALIVNCVLRCKLSLLQAWELNHPHQFSCINWVKASKLDKRKRCNNNNNIIIHQKKKEKLIIIIIILLYNSFLSISSNYWWSIKIKIEFKFVFNQA